MFREQDEHITEPIFLSLSYIQAQHDFLNGNYPVVRDDAAQMCALQIVVAEGAGLQKTDSRFIAAAERFTSTQAHTLTVISHDVCLSGTHVQTS